jgi:hypothetical protein
MKLFKNLNSPHQLPSFVKTSSQVFYTWNLTPACLVNYKKTNMETIIPVCKFIHQVLSAHHCPVLKLTGVAHGAWWAGDLQGAITLFHKMQAGGSKILFPTLLGLNFKKITRPAPYPGICVEGITWLEASLWALQADPCTVASGSTGSPCQSSRARATCHAKLSSVGQLSQVGSLQRTVKGILV